MTPPRKTTRRELLRRAGLCVPIAASAGRSLAQIPDPAPPARNVLLILVSDLRTDLGCFGDPFARTPRIDRLAESGLTFLRNYCQQAASSPSRTSLLTGLRPDTTRVFDDRTHFRRALPNAVTIPEHFRASGFATTAFGAVFASPALEDRRSWSIAPWTAGGAPWRSQENADLADSRHSQLLANAWRAGGSEPDPLTDESAEAPVSWQAVASGDAELPDGRTAREAAEAIGKLKDQRFFLAAGFSRPKFPLVAPKAYFDLYPGGSWGGLRWPEPPRDAPSFALHESREIRAYADIPEQGPILESKAKELIRAYRACVSYTDAQVGILLDALEEHGLADSTVVAVVGVSGSHLGELGLWDKYSNYESATHAPLVVRAPGQRNAGRKTEALVESVDLFPSLCSLCGLPRPTGLEGASWRGLFDDPKRLWKRAAYSQHPRAIPGIGPGMGYSMRTSRHRYTEWSALDSPYSTLELYDYKDAPVEDRNIANRPEHVSLVNGLAHMFREGWQGSLPPTELPMSSRA